MKQCASSRHGGSGGQEEGERSIQWCEAFWFVLLLPLVRRAVTPCYCCAPTWCGGWQERWQWGGRRGKEGDGEAGSDRPEGRWGRTPSGWGSASGTCKPARWLKRKGTRGRLGEGGEGGGGG